MKLTQTTCNVHAQHEPPLQETQGNLDSTDSHWGFALGVPQILGLALGVMQILGFLDTNMLVLVQSIYENYWHNLKQIATEFFSVEMHSGEVSLEHTKNPLHHLWGKQVKSAIKVTFSQ